VRDEGTASIPEPHRIRRIVIACFQALSYTIEKMTTEQEMAAAIHAD
jgi:hypothetical protein